MKGKEISEALPDAQPDPTGRNDAAARAELRRKIERAINSVSAETGSDTPDFILADYLLDCLAAFDKAISKRERWYGRAAAVQDNAVRK